MKKTIYEVALVVAIAIIAYMAGRPNNKILVENPEQNEIVTLDACEIVRDTLGNVKSIWYGEDIYTLDIKAKNKL